MTEILTVRTEQKNIKFELTFDKLIIQCKTCRISYKMLKQQHAKPHLA